jgi:hypothetical protein
VRFILHVGSGWVVAIVRGNHSLVKSYVTSHYIALLESLFEDFENWANLPCSVRLGSRIVVVGDMKKILIS